MFVCLLAGKVVENNTDRQTDLKHFHKLLTAHQKHRPWHSGDSAKDARANEVPAECGARPPGAAARGSVCSNFVFIVDCVTSLPPLDA